MTRAVVLLSGGIDSATCLALARRDGFEPCALTFRYNQRHAVEIRAADRIAKSQHVAHRLILDVPLDAIGGSALTDNIPVPGASGQQEPGVEEIPATYVPARNTIFLSLALAWAEILEAADIFIGVNAVDYSGYPDCRPEFIRAFEGMANLATREGVQGRLSFRIHTPLMRLGKAEIITRGHELGVDYGLTHSCYNPDQSGLACGHCDSCRLRLKGFREAGLTDPVRYLAG
jgi:7-cyano-7-deazaguanine synthase